MSLNIFECSDGTDCGGVPEINRCGNLMRYYAEIFEQLRDDMLVQKLIGIIFESYGVQLSEEHVRAAFATKFDTWGGALLKIVQRCKLGAAKWMMSDTKKLGGFEIPLVDFSNRPGWQKFKRRDVLRVCLQYAPVHRFLNPGNQLSTYDDSVMLSGDFDIEVFGSSFNTRLPRYGCMFPEVEAPFGAIGTAEEILRGIYEGKIIAKGIMVSPPSPLQLHGMAMIWLKKILDAGIRLNIVLTISSSKRGVFDWSECVGLREYFEEPLRVTHAYEIFGSSKMVRRKLSCDWEEYFYYGGSR